jgi:hypothetical protein
MNAQPTGPWRRRMIRGAVLALLVGAQVVGLPGCGSEGDFEEPVGPGGASSPALGVVELEDAYRQREATRYERLLAEDFRFYPDPRTQVEHGVISLDATDDVALTRRLFESSTIKKIAVELRWSSQPRPSGRLEAPDWVYLDVLDVFLDVDYRLADEEVTTFRVEDQVQRFYFRQGFSAGDTLPESETRERWFLVEWHDAGTGSRSPGGQTSAEPRPVPVVPTTWSTIKFLGNGLP